MTPTQTRGTADCPTPCEGMFRCDSFGWQPAYTAGSTDAKACREGGEASINPTVFSWPFLAVPEKRQRVRCRFKTCTDDEFVGPLPGIDSKKKARN